MHLFSTRGHVDKRNSNLLYMLPHANSSQRTESQSNQMSTFSIALAELE